MKFKLLLMVFGLSLALSACVSSTPSSSAINMSQKRRAILAEGHSKEYVNHYMAGCAVGASEAGISDEAGQAEAWQAGYDACREELLENLQSKNLHADDGTSGRKTASDYNFNERQRMVWEELSK